MRPTNSCAASIKCSNWLRSKRANAMSCWNGSNCPLVDEVVAVLKLLAARNRNRVDVVCGASNAWNSTATRRGKSSATCWTTPAKFTREGTVLLEVRSAADRLTIEVTDSGIGIPADQLDLIFEPFRQVDMSDTRRYGGTG